MVSLPYATKVAGQHGAPMGRRNCLPQNLQGRLHLRRVPMCDGDYDPGGAYWGGGRGTLPLWCAWDAHGEAYYLRAASREAAKQTILELADDVTFYR